MVWLWRPKKFKFGRRWIGPYEVCSRRGVHYSLRSEHGKFLVAHHNQLKFCPIQAKPGIPCHPGPETSGIVYGGSIPAEEQERPGDPRDQVVRARLHYAFLLLWLHVQLWAWRTGFHTHAPSIPQTEIKSMAKYAKFFILQKPEICQGWEKSQVNARLFSLPAIVSRYEA